MKLIDYSDLVDRRIFNSRMSLKRAIDDQGFPPGRLITPNRRVWDEAEVAAWVESRPTVRKKSTRKVMEAA